ncbi:hypothetical protein EV644_103115 [Kribbella orskensis]|uniref:Uncharacterized protein n=1 Tax=Kribbella orskensis TaxID=2512216 RepID=A0ABY2BSB0_9ACTN|nr:hypothetical protein EV642_106305 [Kribbella sp. VKM Ac-2500]TCO27417.1 hypothetical protein EV644_103115 [Kribbella orskensis]
MAARAVRARAVENPPDEKYNCDRMAEVMSDERIS